MADTTDNKAKHGTPSPYNSPVLERLTEWRKKEPYPEPEAACTDCPVALWYLTGDEELTCFCSALHEKTWNGTLRAIKLCDAREQAVKQMNADLAARPSATGAVSGAGE